MTTTSAYLVKWLTHAYEAESRMDRSAARLENYRKENPIPADADHAVLVAIGHDLDQTATRLSRIRKAGRMVRMLRTLEAGSAA